MRRCAGRCRRKARRQPRRMTRRSSRPQLDGYGRGAGRGERARRPPGDQLVAKQVFVETGRRQGNLDRDRQGARGRTDGGHLRPEQAFQQRAGDDQQRHRPGEDRAGRRGRRVVNFSELFIRRPVLTLVTAMLILLLGIQGFMSMTVREYPEVEESVITVTTTYPGASAEPDAGLHHDADRQGRAERRQRRLRDLEQHARLVHRIGEHAAQLRPGQGAGRRSRQGAAGARRSCRPTPTTRSSSRAPA